MRKSGGGIIRHFSNIGYAFFLAQFFTWPLVQIINKVTNINNNILNIVISLIINYIVSVFLYEVVQRNGSILFEKYGNRIMKRLAK